MLEMTFDSRDTVAALDRLEAALARQMPRLLGDVGQLLADRVHADFLVKARGGRGQDGVQWPELSPLEKRRKQRLGQPLIGIASGELSRRANFRHTVGGITAWGKHLSPGEAIIENTDQPTANYFNFHRPFIPTSLPSTWYAQVEALTQAAVDVAAATVFP